MFWGWKTKLTQAIQKKSYCMWLTLSSNLRCPRNEISRRNNLKIIWKTVEEKLKRIPGFKIIGTAKHKTSVISFNIDGLHSYDVGMILDKMGIAVRTGHHCADTVMQHYHIQGTVRISFAFYTTKEEIDFALEQVKSVFEKTLV